MSAIKYNHSEDVINNIYLKEKIKEILYIVFDEGKRCGKSIVVEKKGHYYFDADAVAQDILDLIEEER